MLLLLTVTNYFSHPHPTEQIPPAPPSVLLLLTVTYYFSHPHPTEQIPPAHPSVLVHSAHPSVPVWANPNMLGLLILVCLCWQIPTCRCCSSYSVPVLANPNMLVLLILVCRCFKIPTCWCSGATHPSMLMLANQFVGAGKS